MAYLLTVQPPNRCYASFTQIRIVAVCAHAWRVVPATLALVVAAFFGGDGRLLVALLQIHLTDNAQCGKLFGAKVIQQYRILVVAVDSHASLLIAGDFSVPPKTFQYTQDLVA